MFLLILIAFFIFIGIILYNISTNTEEFSYYCKTCEGRKYGQCMRCLNCGFKSKEGKGKCVPGDMYGEYNKDNIYKKSLWLQNDEFWTNFWLSDNEIWPATKI